MTDILYGIMGKLVTFRSATVDDFSYAQKLYLEAMEPLTSKLMEWDEKKQTASFAHHWNQQNVQIIRYSDADIGWLQCQQLPKAIHLHQMFIDPRYRGQGIGTAALEELQVTWTDTCKPVYLMVLKNNPARRLYKRFGFQITREEGVKFEMVRMPDDGR